MQSWRVSITMEAAFCVETLEDALARHGKPEILNTDQGSQFTGAAFTGVTSALGYRGSLQVINEIAPAEKRAEVISSYQIVCFLGNSLPVVGVGILSAAYDAITATVSLAVAIALLSAVALATELTFGNRGPARRFV